MTLLSTSLQHGRTVLIKRLFITIFLFPFLCSAESLKPVPAADQYTIAQLAYQKALQSKNTKLAKDEFLYAEKKLMNYLTLFPRSEHAANAFFYLANCQTSLGKEEDALASYIEVIKRTHEGPQAGASALQIGFAQYKEKEYESASQYLELALSQLGPTKSRAAAAFKKALCHQHLNQDAEKDAALDIVLSEKDGKNYHSACRFMKGELALKREDFQSAYDYFKQCANDSELKIRAQAVHKCALLAQKLGDKAAASEYFSRVLKTPSLKEFHPSTALILMNIAAEKNEWKEVSKYEKYGDTGLSEGQLQSRLLLLAKSYDAQKNKKKASGYYTKLAEVSAGTTTGFEVSYLQLSAKGTAQVNLIELEKFLTLYAGEFKEDPRYESVKLLLAEKLYADERYTEALQVYEQLRLDKISEDNVPTIAYRICKIAQRGERPTDALPYISQFVESYPEDLRSAYLLYDQASIQTDAGETQQAIFTYMEVINHKESKGELIKPAWLNIAKLNLQEENYEDAIAAYESLNLKYTKGTDKNELAEWQFWLAYAQFKLDKIQEAQENFSKARSYDKKVKEQEVTQYLALIAYSLKDNDSLRKEVHKYSSYGLTPLPRPIYLSLAIEDSKEKEWDSAWKWFSSCIDSDNIKSDDLITPLIIETYAEAAIETRHFREALSATSFLKTISLEPYRKAVNLYRSSLSHYSLSGARSANDDVEAGLLINPQGKLKYELLLLHGKIEMDEGRIGNGKRVLTNVYQFADREHLSLKKEALLYLIKTFERNPSSEGQNQLKEYQKELELLR